MRSARSMAGRSYSVVIPSGQRTVTCAGPPAAPSPKCCVRGICEPHVALPPSTSRMRVTPIESRTVTLAPSAEVLPVGSARRTSTQWLPL